ncbi:MAG: hypothetical protein J6Q19_02055, partial [Bacteroidaceae bacterium]|nr:hypothetical protein [Bacteroidaceae bacterium]
MRKLLWVFVLFTAFTFSCCEESFDGLDLTNRVENLENRVSALEEECRKINTNVAALQTIVSALQQNDYITAVTPINEGEKVIGYTITFVKNNPITIYHGKDGADGAPGKDGENGKDGVDGKDGQDG